MSDINSYSFMRWKDDIHHFLWKSYKYFLAWGERCELEKCLDELKGTIGTYLLEGDREYLIKEFENKLSKLDKKENNNDKKDV